MRFVGFKAFKEVAFLYRDLIFGAPDQTEYEREQHEMRLKARNMAEAEYHRRLADFYTDRLLDIDPNTDWWGFAEAKQKQCDHQADCRRYEQRAGIASYDATDIPTLARVVRQQQQENS